MLGVVGSSLKVVKFEPTTPNMLQNIATRWPNAHNMLRPTMLRYVALICCDRLAGDLDVFTPPSRVKGWVWGINISLKVFDRSPLHFLFRDAVIRHSVGS